MYAVSWTWLCTVCPLYLEEVRMCGFVWAHYLTCDPHHWASCKNLSYNQLCFYIDVQIFPQICGIHMLLLYSNTWQWNITCCISFISMTIFSPWLKSWAALLQQDFFKHLTSNQTIPSYFCSPCSSALLGHINLYYWMRKCHPWRTTLAQITKEIWKQFEVHFVCRLVFSPFPLPARLSH